MARLGLHQTNALHPNELGLGTVKARVRARWGKKLKYGLN